MFSKFSQHLLLFSNSLQTINLVFKIKVIIDTKKPTIMESALKSLSLPVKYPNELAINGNTAKF